MDRAWGQLVAALGIRPSEETDSSVNLRIVFVLILVLGLGTSTTDDEFEFEGEADSVMVPQRDRPIHTRENDKSGIDPIARSEQDHFVATPQPGFNRTAPDSRRSRRFPR